MAEEVKKSNLKPNRNDYGLKDQEWGYTKQKEESWLPISDSYDDVVENPINQVLGSFKNEFLKNEVNSQALFQQLNSDLIEFSDRISESPFYERMPIVMLVENILTKYVNWASSMRQNIFLSKEKMQEIYTTIEKHYIRKEEVNRISDEANAAMAEIREKYDNQWKDGTIKSTTSKLNGRILIKDVTPEFYAALAEGQTVILKKSLEKN